MDYDYTPYTNASYSNVSVFELNDTNAAPSTSPSPDCSEFRFVFNSLVIGTVSLLGIVGNALSIAVLQRDRHNRVATFLLQALAISDSFVLLISLLFLSLVYSLLPYVNLAHVCNAIIPYVVKFINPLGYMAQCSTIWITVLLALNRYIAIIKPFHAVSWCSLTRVRKQVALVLALALLLNLPRFFQYRLVYLKHGNLTRVTLAETSIGEHSIFGAVYTNIIYTVVVLIIPLLLLIVVNSRLIHEIKFVWKNRSIISKLSGSLQRKDSCKRPPLPEEDNITFIMVIIIVVLIVCHTPDRFFQIYRYFFTAHAQLQCGQTLYYVSSVCNLLIVVNSSCNFLIYFLLRRRFRRILVARLCGWWWGGDRGDPLDGTPRSSVCQAPLNRRLTEGVMVASLEEEKPARRSTVI